MNISIIGTGYVGLVTGACFADAGFSVTCHDINQSRVNMLLEGNVPFYEPGLGEMILHSIETKKIEFTSSFADILKNHIIFVCVGTPDKGNGTSDLSALYDVFESIEENISQDSIIFIKSTVPLGTSTEIYKRFKKLFQNPKFDVQLASNPEFLKEGDAINDFKKPDRIIIGTDSEEVRSTAAKLYKPFNWQKNRLIFMSRESAELTKYASNSMLAMRITFMNELSRLCDISSANIHEIRSGVGSDKRIGADFLYAGTGYGGSCFPKDVVSLIKTFEKNRLQSDLISSIDIANKNQINYFFQKITSFYNKKASSKNLLIWGLSFKPNTDDIRESIAIMLAKKLSGSFNELYLYDPIALPNAKNELNEYGNISFLNSKYEAVEKANALVLCTEWKEFWQPDLSILKLLKDKVIFDGRNLYNKNDLEEYGINHIGIGT
ncbi:UDP-glucose/GDP-mannose dehydrogenase family protein [Gammaproteobacteria bacterium]|nr:UDP-glucose/GDP-mannose dehydrogenase family protein [Gammaproteobacteria bacterium]